MSLDEMETGGSQGRFLASVVLSCCGGEGKLRRCLDSLVGQTVGLERLELILVDGASTDGSLSVCKEYEGKYPDNILVVSLGQKVGKGTARNIGLEYASSEYVGFLDGDSWAEPDLYRLLYEAAQEGKADVAFCGTDRREGKFLPFLFCCSAGAEQMVLGEGEGRERFLFKNRDNTHCANKLFRRSFLAENGLRFPEEFQSGEDYFGILSFLHAGRAARVRRDLCHCPEPYGRGENPWAAGEMADRMGEQLALYQECARRGFMDKYRDFLQYRFYHKMTEEIALCVRNGQDAGRLMGELAEILVSLRVSIRENPYWLSLYGAGAEKLYVDVLMGVGEKGGVENVVQRMIETLESPRIHFRVIQLIWKGIPWLGEGIEFYPLQYLDEEIKNYNLQELAQSYGDFLLRQPGKKPDVILAVSWPNLCLVARKVTETLGLSVKVVSWLHSELERCQAAGKGNWEHMASADAHLAITGNIERQIREHFPNKTVYRIYNPAELPRDYPIQGNAPLSHRLLFVGRLSREKDVGFLLRALAERRNWELHIIGDGPEEEKLRQRVGSLRLGRRVTWHGWRRDPWNNVVDISQMDALVLSSVFEGFPLAVIEAQSRGLPAIVSNVGGLEEYIEDGVNGYVYPAGNLPAFLKILDRVEAQGYVVPDRRVCRERAKPYERVRALGDMEEKLWRIAGREIPERRRLPFPGPKDKISVIVPCYNVERYVARCLDSILCQSAEGAELEVVCVDDASTDGTPSILRQYHQRYPGQIVLVMLEENGKLGRARNIGLQAASGNYITYVDSDDAVRDGMLRVMYQEMREKPCDLVECGFEKMSVLPENTEVSSDEAVLGRFLDLSVDSIKRKWMVGKLGENRVMGKLYRREFLEEHRISFPENVFMEDIYFTGLCMLYAKSCIVVKEPYYCYLVRPGSIMNTEAAIRYHTHVFQVQNMLTRRAMEEKLPEVYWKEYMVRHLFQAFIMPLENMRKNPRLFSYPVIQEMKRDLLGFYPSAPQVFQSIKIAGGTTPMSFYQDILEKDYSQEELRGMFFQKG